MQLQDALTSMLRRAGKSKEDFRSNSNVGRLFKRYGVEKTPELERILWLPSRSWEDDEGLEAMRILMTRWLRREGGEQELRTIQAKALEDLHDWKGLFAPMQVGSGKTLVSWLAGIVSGAQRPMLLVPAKLRDKTRREFAALKAHWRAVPPRILSYEEISRDAGWEKLEAAVPDLIVMDEAHRAKSKDAGVTRKLLRWHKEHPETRLCAMSGTITTRSLREYGHLAEWALGKLCPVPRQANWLADWADALDEKISPDRRLAPGALLALCSDEELDEVADNQTAATEIVRKAFQRRLNSTPGVVTKTDGGIKNSLAITVQRPIPGEKTWPAFEKLRRDWETPGGEPFTEAADLWRHARTLCCGFYYVWDPPGPPEWMAARREWARFARDILSLRFKGVDTELQVVNACDHVRDGTGMVSDTKLWRDGIALLEAWREVRPTFRPNSVPQWIDNGMLAWTAKWLDAQDGPAIVWCEHVAFCERLSSDAKLPYFGKGGKDAHGRMIEEMEGRQHVIASVASNCEGRNLQPWSRNLVISCQPNGRILEQLLGRTHREGQEADEVSADIVVACIEQWKGLNQAVADAHYVEQTTGQPQKLCYADWTGMPTPQEVAAWQLADPMWKE